jgi:hypothetical protein
LKPYKSKEDAIVKKDFARLVVPVFFSFIGLTLLILVSCGGGGGSDGGGAVGFTGTNNAANNWVFRTDSAGYSGGNVIFGGLKIEGEWQANRTLNKSGGPDSFVSTTRYTVLGIKFDTSYYEYWVEWVLVGGRVTSNAAWTPCGSYGVSQDGTVLVIDTNSYNYKSSHNAADGKPCLFVTENNTGDEYDLCRIADN